jgi:hypothetical protein
MVTGAGSAASGLFMVICFGFAFFGVRAPAWTVWPMGGLIVVNPVLAVAYLTVWPERRDDEAE